MRPIDWMLGAFLASGCGAGDNSGGPTSDAISAADGTLSNDATVSENPDFDEGYSRGRIEVVHNATDTSSPLVVRALFSSDPTKVRMVGFYGYIAPHWQREVARQGDCRLLRNEPFFCERCAGLCVGENECEDFPTHDSVGELTVSGLPQQFVLTDNYTGWYDPKMYGSLNFSSALTMHVDASGDELPAFSAELAGVSPLVAELSLTEAVTLPDDSDTTLQWTAPTSADSAVRVRLMINANNAGHGQPYEAVLECDTVDDGSLTISKTLISGLPKIESWLACAGSDCPPSVIMRYRKKSIELEGTPIHFFVGSQILFTADHAAANF